MNKDKMRTFRIKTAMKKIVLIMACILTFSGFFQAQVNGFLHAYDSMHQVISVYYPMGTWKAIDWNSLDAAIRPEVIAAGETGDSVAFYIALVRYIDALHDGHTNIRHGWPSVRQEAMYSQIGGSYGFVVSGLDNGRIVVRLIHPGSPADLAGIRLGAEILEVDDVPVHLALDTLPVLWADLVPATAEAKTLYQYRLIGRAPVGHQIRIKYHNRDAAQPETTFLTAVDDNYATFSQTTMLPMEPGPVVTVKVLDDGYGYIRLNSV